VSFLGLLTRNIARGLINYPYDYCLHHPCRSPHTSREVLRFRIESCRPLHVRCVQDEQDISDEPHDSTDHDEQRKTRNGARIRIYQMYRTFFRKKFSPIFFDLIRSSGTDIEVLTEIRNTTG